MTDMEALEALVGEWTSEVVMEGIDGTVRGAMSVEWPEGGGYLIQRSTADDPRFPRTVAVIGPDRSGEMIVQHYSTPAGWPASTRSRRARSAYAERDDEDFAQRYTGRFSDDGSAIEGAWEAGGGRHLGARLRHHVPEEAPATEGARNVSVLLHGGERLTHLGQAGAQLRVADLDRPHRVLQLAQPLVGVRDRVGGVLDELARLRGGVRGPPRREGAGLEPVALREARVRAPRAPERPLHGPEQLLLEPVGVPSSSRS